MGYIKRTIKRNDFLSIDEFCYFDDNKPYKLGIKTSSARNYKTIACFTSMQQAEQAYDTLSSTIKSIIRYETKKH